MYTSSMTITSTNQQALIKAKETLKSKLSYEWKKIYRILNLNDTHACGLVSSHKFEQAVL